MVEESPSVGCSKDDTACRSQGGAVVDSTLTETESGPGPLRLWRQPRGSQVLRKQSPMVKVGSIFQSGTLPQGSSAKQKGGCTALKRRKSSCEFSHNSAAHGKKQPSLFSSLSVKRLQGAI